MNIRIDPKITVKDLSKMFKENGFQLIKSLNKDEYILIRAQTDVKELYKAGM
jgi:hypothetical protein